MKYCPYCGASVWNDAAFCMSCGKPVPVVSEQPMPAEHQSAPENGTAVVSVTLRTDSMPMPIDDVLLSIQSQRTVVSIRRTIKEL